jgi:hypothetical protein
MSPKNHALTIAALEKCVSDSTRPEKLRRSAALRLSRLRAAVKRPATITTRTTAPALAPSEDAKFEAVQAFRALSAQRSALIRKRRTAGEQEAFAALIALMPASVPQDNDPTAWRNFVGQIDGLLSEIKTIKHL